MASQISFALELTQVCKNFGGLQVLRSVSFALTPGQRTAVIGPNGAGKTTLLSIITGVHRPSSGSVWLHSQEMTHLPPHHRSKLGVGCGFQLNRLFHSLTVEENVRLALLGTQPLLNKTFRPMFVQRTLIAEAQRLLESVDLWERRGEIVGALAYGEQRKLEILFGLAAHPRLLVLDEPTAGLALSEIAPFMDSIRKLSAGTTIIFTSHDMDVVFGLADHLVVLFFGEVVAQGTPEEIRTNPVVREIYLGAH